MPRNPTDKSYVIDAITRLHLQGKVAPKGLLHREPQNFDMRWSVCLRDTHVSSKNKQIYQMQVSPKKVPFLITLLLPSKRCHTLEQFGHSKCFLQSNIAIFGVPKMDQKRCD